MTLSDYFSDRINPLYEMINFYNRFVAKYAHTYLK